MSRRSNFTHNTKRILAERVGYRCSFPGCEIMTVGPQLGQKKSINVGEAAHIYAASDGGPRPRFDATEKELSSQENGIWLCRNHAALIDRDEDQYTADTLKVWKAEAERKASEVFMNRPNEDTRSLISISSLFFWGNWIVVKEDLWVFVVKSFLEGDMSSLRDYVSSFGSIYGYQKYVLVDTQGDGRRLSGIELCFVNGVYELRCYVAPKNEGYDVRRLADFKMSDGDLVIESGDFALVTGYEAARQLLEMTLNIRPGELGFAPLHGACLDSVFAKYSSNEDHLRRMILIEMAR